jgi:TPR repeat protein
LSVAEKGFAASGEKLLNASVIQREQERAREREREALFNRPRSFAGNNNSHDGINFATLPNSGSVYIEGVGVAQNAAASVLAFSDEANLKLIRCNAIASLALAGHRYRTKFFMPNSLKTRSDVV